MRVLFEHLGDRQVRGILRSVDSDDPGALADLVGWWPELTNERKVELLETIDVEERDSLVLGWAKEAIAERELSEKIANDVREGLDDPQREALTLSQTADIRKGLGDAERAGTEVDEHRAGIEPL